MIRGNWTSLVLSAVLTSGGAAHAADVFPDKQIRIVVASAAGGASDIAARLRSGI